MKRILKLIYILIPFKRSLFDILKLVSHPSERIYQHLHFKGAFTHKLKTGEEFKLNADNSQFENEIYWGGIENCWEQTSIPIWLKLARKSKVVFDIGAQAGIFSILTKAVNPNSEVHAFEPTDRFYKQLLVNNTLNNYDIHCHKQAISNSTGENEVKTVWQKNKVVKTITLDDFIVQNSIGPIDLIKVDVDFHEVAVAEGFVRYFKEFQPTLLIEVLKDEVAQGIEKHLKTGELGYLVYSIHEKKGTIRQLPDMQKRGDNMNFLLCKPSVAEYLGI